MPRGLPRAPVAVGRPPGLPPSKAPGFGGSAAPAGTSPAASQTVQVTRTVISDATKATPLVGASARGRVRIQNIGSFAVSIGGDSSVTFATGRKLYPSDFDVYEVTAGLWAITANANAATRLIIETES